MKDILERIEDSSHNESSHELICRLLDCADEIKKLRASSTESASPTHTESAAPVGTYIAQTEWPVKQIGIPHPSDEPVTVTCNPAPSPVSGADELADDARVAALCDGQYVAGLKAGFRLGDHGDNEGLAKAIDSRGGYVAVLRSTRLALTPTPTGQQALSDETLRPIQDVLREVDPGWRERGEFGVKPVDQIISAIRDLARAAAPQAVALTDEQIDAIAKQVMPYWAEWTFSTRAFARAILAAAPTTTGHTVFGEIVALLAPFTRFNYEALDAIPFEEDWSDSREQRIYGERVAEAAMRSCDFQLRQRVAALAATPAPATADARDAARYRWLSRQAVATRTYEDHSNRWEVDYVLRGTSFGAAIDAAMHRSGKS